MSCVYFLLFKKNEQAHNSIIPQLH